MYQPSSDLNFSTDDNTHSTDRHQHGQPVGDEQPSVDASSSKQAERELVGGVAGQGNPAPNKAGAFLSGEGTFPQAPRGPRQERPRLSTDRPLDSMHLGKICSRATKDLLRDLKVAADLTDLEYSETKGKDRSTACKIILDIWRRKEPTRSVFDLRLLLTRAGGEDETKYGQLIREIVDYPP